MVTATPTKDLETDLVRWSIPHHPLCVFQNLYANKVITYKGQLLAGGLRASHISRQVAEHRPLGAERVKNQTLVKAKISACALAWILHRAL